jgi:hypothetical protein
MELCVRNRALCIRGSAGAASGIGTIHAGQALQNACSVASSSTFSPLLAAVPSNLEAS